MFYVSLRNKKIEFSITHVEPEEKYTFSPDENGVRELWNLLDEKNALSEVMFSSSVDFPQDAGLPDDFDLSDMLRKIQETENETALDDLFASIDKLVKEGKIEELAERTKKYILHSVGR